MEEEKLRHRYNELDDMAVTTASAFLGLTLGCARCHDHKFDPIPTRDYYRLQCAFTTDQARGSPARDTGRGGPVSRAGIAMEGAAEGGPGRVEGLARGAEEAARRSLRHAKIDALPIGDAEKALLKEQPDSEEAKKLAKKHEKALAVTDDD